MIYTICKNDNELQQIIDLQIQNLPISISKEEKGTEGFLTVQHDFSLLKRMNDITPHIIAKYNDQVAAYALCMSKEFKDDIEILKPMFRKIEDSPVGKSSYMVMGQICVAKAYRRQGVFKNLYFKMKEVLQTDYDFLVTEVAAMNNRSLQAHYAIGFNDLEVYEDNHLTWHLMSWSLT